MDLNEAAHRIAARVAGLASENVGVETSHRPDELTVHAWSDLIDQTVARAKQHFVEQSRAQVTVGMPPPEPAAASAPGGSKINRCRREFPRG